MLVPPTLVSPRPIKPLSNQILPPFVSTIEISKGGLIWIDLPTTNVVPGNPGNWTSNGSILIKQGGLIPDGRILYKAFPGGDDYFTYKVRYKAHNIL